ncbi:MAG: RagB/SusD family nutrient uptake outer membrane protein [Tannerellaceae bacterium]|nr:RagB/SusD family nutrient uptake outer membrane protein [Tannerellaceae bacterium]
MKSIYYFTGLFLLLAFTNSCSDFLEVPTKNFVPDDVLWSTESNADLFLNDIYNSLPDVQEQTQHLDQFTDNSDVGVLWMEGYNHIATAQVTPTNFPHGLGGTDNKYESMWYWPECYKRIRKCNTFIKKVTESELPESYKILRIAEARFLRALNYHWMWMSYGGVPLIDIVLNNQNPDLPLEYPRATAEETFDFIVKELTEAAADLPVTVSDSDQGRATKGAALTVKGWCELFHASKLRNPSNDIERWKNAAKTNKEVMALEAYDLAADFDELFLINNNRESIFARQYGPDKGSNKEGRFGPARIGSYTPGWGNFLPTQELVDEFSMANGLAIYEPGSGYDPDHPYEGREPRFYATIIHDNSLWANEYPITTRVGGNNPIDMGYSSDNTHTGYYARKRLNENKELSLFHDGKSYENYMFFRYGEVLLNFAEAENEVNGPTSEVLEAVNKVRTRNNNLPTIEATYGIVDKERMREIIHRERRVELCFEDKRWWDILRWKIADQLPDGSPGVLNRPQKGMLIEENSDGTLTYTVTEIRNRIFLPKMYTMPIPQDAIDRNSVIAAQNGGPDNWTNGQNPGY